MDCLYIILLSAIFIGFNIFRHEKEIKGYEKRFSNLMHYYRKVIRQGLKDTQSANEALIKGMIMNEDLVVVFNDSIEVGKFAKMMGVEMDSSSFTPQGTFVYEKDQLKVVYNPTALLEVEQGKKINFKVLKFFMVEKLGG